MPEHEATGTDSSNLNVALLQMMTGYWVSKAVYVAAKLGIADLVSGGPVHCDELARLTGTHAPSLNLTMRALASVGIFSEGNGQFAQTPMSGLLQTTVPNSMRALAIMYGEEQYRAWSNLLHSVRTGEPAFEHEFGVSVFEYFGQHPEASAVFNDAMTNWTTQVAVAVAGAYDFSRFGTVVDVGGNQGTLLAAILRGYPNAHGILFDLPHVVASARDHLEAAGIQSRCRIIGGDFFKEVPPEGDAYLLAQILHDWDDERCIAILVQCRRVMSDEGRLLVVELVLPEGNDPFFGKWLDMHMLVMASGRERTLDQYRKLLQMGGFEVTRVVPTPAGSSVVEARPV